MNRNKLKLFLFGIIVIAGVLSIREFSSAKAISTSDPNYVEIETTLQKYANLRIKFLYTMDDSELSQIYANDPRGGLVDSHYLKLVQYIQGNPDLKLEDIGFLDKEIAIKAFDRKAKELYDEALASGEIKPPTLPTYDPSDNPISDDIKGTDKDPRTHIPRADPQSVSKIRDMEKEAQFSAKFPADPPAKLTPMNFKILSIFVDGDLAHAKIDWPYGVEEDILVYKEGNWYLVGTNVIEWHAG